MKRIISFLLCLCLSGAILSCPTYGATSWPSNVSISAEAGIIMDANTGTVLYEKNSTLPYYPASITKVLTALIVIENCNLDDIVTFSSTAVHSVESGSSSAGLDTGDQLTVRDCLYAMLLKSANEAANALAEHTSGSIEAFSAVMNAKAASLGCTSSHFANPSGLNDPYHYTSAYDMALISQAAFSNSTFVAIDSSLYYDLPATKHNPDGLRIYPGHRMMKRNMSQYYPGIIGGKTGYTSLAGNTLITCAERNGMKVVAVILNGHQTHYTDTKTLLDFGFGNFHSLEISDLDTSYSALSNDMTIGGLPVTDLSILHLQRNCKISLPVTGDFSDVTSQISYELPENAPENAISLISYEYSGHQVGSTYLMYNALGANATEAAAEVTTEAFPSSPAALEEALSSSSETAESSATSESAAVAAPESLGRNTFLSVVLGFFKVLLLLALFFAMAGGTLYALRAYIARKEDSQRQSRYERRKERLKDMGISSAEFDSILEKKRSSNRQGKKKGFQWREK